MKRINYFKSDALFYLELAKTAKFNKNKLMKRYKDEYFNWIENKETNTEGFSFYDKNKKFLIFSFRGTTSVKDWLSDINAFHMVIPYNNDKTNIRVHKGIMKCYLSIRTQVQAIIQYHLNAHPIERIIGVGHSLGGSIATLFTVDMQYNFNKKIYSFAGYSYGSPRVFNRAGVKSFNKRVNNFYRTFVKNDWVVLLPPKWIGIAFKGGYFHVKNKISLGRANPFFKIKIWFKLLKKEGITELLGNLTNHSISVYRRLLKK